MAEPDNSLPLLTTGKLPRTDYAYWQEFADDLVKILRFTNDYLQTVEGAKGKDGKDGLKGDKGEKGDVGASATFAANNSTYAVANGERYVDIPFFSGWEKATYLVRYNGQVGGTDGVNDYPETAFPAISTILQVYESTGTTLIRVYLTEVVDDDNFLVGVTKYE